MPNFHQVPFGAISSGIPTKRQPLPRGQRFNGCGAEHDWAPLGKIVVAQDPDAGEKRALGIEACRQCGATRLEQAAFDDWAETVDATRAILER